VTIDGTSFKWAITGDVAVKTPDPLIVRTMGVGNDPFHQLTGKPSCQHCITSATVVELINVLVTIDGTAFKWAVAGDVAVKTSDSLIIRTMGVVTFLFINRPVNLHANTVLRT
jgi:hypothetical protein